MQHPRHPRGGAAMPQPTDWLAALPNHIPGLLYAEIGHSCFEGTQKVAVNRMWNKKFHVECTSSCLPRHGSEGEGDAGGEGAGEVPGGAVEEGGERPREPGREGGDQLADTVDEPGDGSKRRGRARRLACDQLGEQGLQQQHGLLPLACCHGMRALIHVPRHAPAFFHPFHQALW